MGMVCLSPCSFFTLREKGAKNAKIGVLQRFALQHPNFRFLLPAP